MVIPTTTGTSISASQLLKTGEGVITGIFVSSASNTPTIKLWNSLAASGEVMIETFTPVAGTMYNFGTRNRFGTGLFITIGGTVACTPFID